MSEFHIKHFVVDPTAADPRIPAPGADGKRPTTAVYNADTGAIGTMPAYMFWALFLLGFAYLASVLPIWRFAQPVNYIGFWITLIVIGLSMVGAILAMVLGPVGATRNEQGATVWSGPVNGAVVVINNGINSISGGKALFTVVDPTAADPRIPAPNAEGVRPTTAKYNAETKEIYTLPSYMLWALFHLVFLSLRRIDSM